MRDFVLLCYVIYSRYFTLRHYIHQPIGAILIKLKCHFLFLTTSLSSAHSIGHCCGSSFHPLILTVTVHILCPCSILKMSSWLSWNLNNYLSCLALNHICTPTEMYVISPLFSKLIFLLMFIYAKREGVSAHIISGNMMLKHLEYASLPRIYKGFQCIDLATADMFLMETSGYKVMEGLSPWASFLAPQFGAVVLSFVSPIHGRRRCSTVAGT